MIFQSIARIHLLGEAEVDRLRLSTRSRPPSRSRSRSRSLFRSRSRSRSFPRPVSRDGFCSRSFSLSTRSTSRGRCESFLPKSHSRTGRSATGIYFPHMNKNEHFKY